MDLPCYNLLKFPCQTKPGPILSTFNSKISFVSTESLDLITGAIRRIVILHFWGFQTLNLRLGLHDLHHFQMSKVSNTQRCCNISKQILIFLLFSKMQPTRQFIIVPGVNWTTFIGVFWPKILFSDRLHMGYSVKRDQLLSFSSISFKLLFVISQW